MTEKYTLNWQTFSDHLKLMFKDLYQEGSHSDVTLVSDDQTQFKAHKIVLSACSPVFKKIIESNPSQHPLIYLRGIQSYEMESILQFMYLGEGKFYHERMREFNKVAQDLEVKEISDGVELPSDEAEETIEENIPEEETGEDLDLQNLVIFRIIFSLYMKVSSILVISVISNSLKRVIFRGIFILYMKESSIPVISVIIKLHNRVNSRLTYQRSTVTQF